MKKKLFSAFCALALLMSLSLASFYTPKSQAGDAFLATETENKTKKETPVADIKDYDILDEDLTEDEKEDEDTLESNEESEENVGEGAETEITSAESGSNVEVSNTNANNSNVGISTSTNTNASSQVSGSNSGACTPSSNHSSGCNQSQGSSEPAKQPVWVPDEYGTRKVVTKAAWTENIPVYERQAREICNDCGADITGNSGHTLEESLSGGKGSSYVTYVNVQTGNRQVNHPEESYMERYLVRAGYWKNN